MAEESLSGYLVVWDMLAMSMKLQLSELPHLVPIVKELNALVSEARELEGLVQESAKERLVPAPDQPPGRGAAAEDAERRIHHQRRGRRRDVAVGARKSINPRTTRKSGRAQD